MTPSNASNFHNHQVDGESRQVQDQADDLESEVEGALWLGILYRASITVFSISCDDSNQHSYDAEWEIDNGEEVEQRQQIGSDHASGDEQGPFNPFNHVESCHQGDGCVVYGACFRWGALCFSTWDQTRLA